jgi:hypothetical protein
VIKSVTHITVEGRGAFPIDMLRYDQCHPRTERDSLVIKNSFDPHIGKRTVDLTSYALFPTEERWKSFGWEVIGKAKHRL